MGSDTNADRRRLAHRPPAVVNRMVLAVLRSPLHGSLDPGICELRYRGRRTGRMVALPVIYARYGERFVVVVGDASDKRWWRNFTDPRQVEVRRGRQRGVGTCRVVTPDDPDYEPAWCAYAQRQHVTLEPGDRLLVIDLPVSPAAGVRPGR